MTAASHRVVASPRPGDGPVVRRRRVRALRVLTATTVCLALATGAALTTGAWPLQPAAGTGPGKPHASPAPAPPPVAVAPAPAAPSAARTAAGIWPATGALFGGPPDDPGSHYCTASVVSSPSGNIVMTAAHCVADGDGTPARSGMSFAPGYHDGVAPNGYWTVTAAAVDQAWLADGDPDDDVAFLTVAQPGSAQIQQVTGAYEMTFSAAAAGAAVTTVGYNDDEEVATTTSGTATPWSPTQLQLLAPGLADGTSGGPWLTGPDDTQIIGVTGGYEQGGDGPEVSYAAVSGAAIHSLFGRVAGSAAAA